jgi:hypothetical protein
MAKIFVTGHNRANDKNAARLVREKTKSSHVLLRPIMKRRYWNTKNSLQPESLSRPDKNPY